MAIRHPTLVEWRTAFTFLRRHQPNFVTELAQLASPVVGARASFDANQTWPQSLKEPLHLAAAKLSFDPNLLGVIDTVNLEHVLGDIQTDRGNLHVDGSLM